MFKPCTLYIDESHCKGGAPHFHFSPLLKTPLFLTFFCFDTFRLASGNLEVTASCSDGYKGTACSECADDYYRFFAICYPCEKWAKLRNIALVVGLVLCWVATNN